ncbi:uncharacterized protein OCT59_026457 [Rhizophagus irregularis]|nr:hypothetical protein OCT59_026457 [Rhizophagus irregularis]
MPLPQSLKPQSLSPSPFLSFETTPNSSLISDEITRNLYIRLDEINQQCTVTKNIYTVIIRWSGKMDASNQIAQTVWSKGKHTKLESLLNDEDFKEECQAWLRQQKPESRTPGNLKVYIEGMVFPKLTGHIKKDTISEKTCRNYMYLWRYKYDERKKGVYYDGHERPDVVKYRKEWLKRMFEYQRLMKDFDGDMMDIVSEPQLKLGDKELVQITHDECHFYANDGQRRIWMREDEDILCSKHQGRSIMVSAFLCLYHGLLQLSDEQMRENPHIKSKEAFILRSVQTDGYWKSEHMLDQLVHQAIPIFEILHPGCVGVFCFDQSTNHNAMAADALIAVRMNLSPGGAQPKMRDGKPKGIKQVLTECNIWPEKGIRLMCEQCSGKQDDIVSERLDCCARRIMSLQPDFCEQRSILKEAIIKAGHIFERYPKFHCECNFIERYWGFAKRETRRLCNYNYNDLLLKVPEVLISVPVTTIHKFACKSWRYMDAYNKGLEGRTAEWAVSKYKSHHRLPDNIERIMDDLDNT